MNNEKPHRDWWFLFLTNTNYKKRYLLSFDGFAGIFRPQKEQTIKFKINKNDK